MTSEWEKRLADLWASLDDHGEDDFVQRMDALVAELPADSAVGLYERASAFDSTGHSDLAIPLYRRALEVGLGDDRRRQAVIQLASSLRNVGQASESVALLSAERDRGSDELDDALDAFLALALTSGGREREAVSIALLAVARHMTRYRRSLENYARELADA
jgi:Tetratrico peptide repeat